MSSSSASSPRFRPRTSTSSSRTSPTATRTYEPREEGAQAQSGDKLTIDFVGRIGDEAFEGGTAEGVDLVLGSGSFIPGFEAQLEGAKVGEERKVVVTFPEDYQAAHLAGKEAVFDVTVKAIAAPGDVAVDDELAKKFGFENLGKLREAVTARIKSDYDRASRDKLKRALLDALDKKFDFELPQDMVEQEFSGIWGQIQAEQNATGKTFADEGTTEEEQRAEYRRIAERRVRLGLVVAEVGEKAGVKVGDDEVSRAIVERARQFPGQEKLFWDYYQKNPQALAEIRAPIYEEKVVDHIVSLAKVTDKTVSKDELFKADGRVRKGLILSVLKHLKASAVARAPFLLAAPNPRHRFQTLFIPAPLCSGSGLFRDGLIRDKPGRRRLSGTASGALTGRRPPSGRKARRRADA